MKLNNGVMHLKYIAQKKNSLFNIQYKDNKKNEILAFLIRKLIELLVTYFLKIFGKF